MKRFRSELKKCFFAGLLVLVPLVISVYVIQVLVGVMDSFLGFIPHKYHPDNYLPFHIPGLGLVTAVLVTLLIGMFARNYFGRKLVDFGERILYKIPLVRPVYGATKQLLETVFLKNANAFRRPVLLEYPRRGIYSVAFVTSESAGEVQERTEGEMLNVFVPTTPNPTSGFYLMVPKDEVINLQMSSEDAFKLIMSGGIVTPPPPVKLKEVNTTAQISP